MTNVLTAFRKPITNGHAPRVNKRRGVVRGGRLHRLKPLVRTGRLSPMEALNLCNLERIDGRPVPPNLLAWVEQRIESAKARGGYGWAWVRTVNWRWP